MTSRMRVIYKLFGADWKRHVTSLAEERPWASYLVDNRPFYRYGGHIELIRFKEHYRMPRGHEHISFVF